MGDFNFIETGFNNADETLNFGTRSIGCPTESLFEISTLACLKSEDEHSTGALEVVINAVMRNSHLFLATDKSFKIFSDAEMAQLIYNASFESRIACLALSPDDRFLIIGFESGVIRLFTVDEDEINRIYIECLNENIVPISAYAFDCYEDDEIDSSFLILFQNGLLSRVDVRNGNENGFEITTEEMFNFRTKISISDFSYPLLATNGFESNILNVETKEVVSHEAFKFNNFFTLGSMLLCLDFDGNLLRLCPLTLTTFWVDYDFLIDHMLVMKGVKPQILAVIKPNEIGEIFLQLLESDFSPIFSLKIRYPVHLIQMDFEKSDIVFISKITADDRITELRLQTVYETDHESRLMRLIKRRRFEEAEQFAKTFNIDPSVIRRAKAQLIVDKTKCTSEDIKILLNLMDSINDDHFNLQCCTNVDCSNFDDVRKILTYGSKISPKVGDERREDILNMKEAMLDLRFKFETFMVLSNKDDLQAWCNFSLCNLLLEVKECLKNYQIQDAIIIYSRLDQKAIHSLNEQHIKDILEMFNNLPVDLYQPFLPTFFPITMTHLPSALLLFVNWLLGKIYQLEKRDPANFPENGIKMVEDIVKLIRVEKNKCISFQRHCMSNRGFEDLAGIIEGLNVLQTLKKKFGITVQLNEYLEGPKVLAGTLVKLSMPSEQYDYFLENFLYTYMLQNDIDHDTIFVEEINNLLQFHDNWITIIEVILKHISSVELKLQTVKDILVKTPVPWCEVTRRIAQNALQLTHPLVTEIDNIFKDEPCLMVIKNTKYGIKKEYPDDEFGRIIHRIVYVNEPQMIDDIYQLCKSDDKLLEASVILIRHLIRTGRLDEAMLVFHNRVQNETYSCAKMIADYAALIINKKNNKKIQENYYNVLPKLFKKLIELSATDAEARQFEEDFRILRGVYYFNDKLHCRFTTNDFKCRITRKEKYQELLQIVVDNIDLGSMNFGDVLNYSEKVGYYFSKDKDEVLVTLCEKLKNFDIIYKAGEYLLENDADTKNVCLVAGLFLKFLGYQSASVFETSSLENECDQTLATFENLKYEDDSSKNDIFVNSLTLADKLITKAHMKADPDDILKINELNCWINSCYYLTRQGSTVQDELYKHLYTSKENLPSTNVLCILRNCFDACFFTLDSETLINNVGESCTQPLEHEISHLPSSLDILCREGHYLTAVSLLRILSNRFYLQPSMDKTILKPLRTIILTKFLPQILFAVVSANFVDLDLFYNLLLSVRKEAVRYLFEYLKIYKRQYKKLHDLSVVGIRLLDFYKETKGRDIMLNSVRTCNWWRKLKYARSKIVYDEFFKSDADTRLKQLINLEVIGIDEIRKYCEDFMLSVDQYFKEYLRSSLVNWKPQYEIKFISGKRKVVMKNDEELLQKCQGIINVIEDKERAAVFSSMERMLKEVNFYYYEVFSTIYKILEKNQQVSNSKDIDMLLFLKNYTRFKSPSQREKEEWYITFPDTQILDPLSEFRLPFTPILFTSEIWSILRPEISLESYELWFQVTNILRKNLKVDDICTYAVKQASSGILGDHLAKGWVLYSKFEDLFHEVDKCVQHISNLEGATSVVYHLMNHTPDGADKVRAAELCFKYAMTYRNNHSNDSVVERAFVKVKNKFYGLSVCHILHRFNLAKENYLKLVTQPQNLIESLYMDERIPKYAGTFCLEYSDINNAVEALSELFDLDIQEIRLDLLNSWLSSSYTEVDMDTTSYFIPVVQNPATRINNSEDALKRSVYICSSGNQQFWRSYLLRMGLDEEEVDQKNLSFKAKALKCFCAITDENTIVQMTRLSHNEFLNYIDKLTLLSELESLGIFLNIDSLHQYNKRELLKKLSSMGKPLAIKCMGAICITYFLEEDKYWEYIINSSIKLEMIEELSIYVEFLKDKCDKYYYVNAWQALIDKSFQQIFTISDEKDLEESLVNNFLMIQSCPVSFSLSFEKIMESCINLGKSEYAALLLQYIPEGKWTSVSKEFLTSKSISSNLEKLEKKGLWGVRSLKTQLGLNN